MSTLVTQLYLLEKLTLGQDEWRAAIDAARTQQEKR